LGGKCGVGMENVSVAGFVKINEIIYAFIKG
jgi:hypothetical protein